MTTGIPPGGVEITIFSKIGGPLSKCISLQGDAIVSDGTACVMTEGTAQRVQLPGVRDLAAIIGRLESHQALALGALRPGLPEEVAIKTKARINGAVVADTIARTKDNIIYLPGTPAFALIDFDRKGMPDAVASRIEELGGLWLALISVLPALAGMARVERVSTSAGLRRADTGERIDASGGAHVYVHVRDGIDIERFLKTLHKRCWLAGLGWMMVGAGGQLLERSIVDRIVGTPERLVFEGPPVLAPPLEQDAAARKPTAYSGEMLDTLAACPPLTIAETARLNELRTKEAVRLADKVAAARKAFIAQQARRLVEQASIPYDHASQIVERQCEGVLLPNVNLPFDDAALAGTTVAELLAHPEKYEGATLADPLEGIKYGRGKAKVMLRGNGELWIHSFAHGRTVYELKYDAHAIEVAIQQAQPDRAAELFLRLVLAGDLDPVEIERLKGLVCKRSGVGPRAVGTMLTQRRKIEAQRRAKQEQEHRLAERTDPRPAIPVPLTDDPWLPQMDTLNEILNPRGSNR